MTVIVDDNPKKPRPVPVVKKRPGVHERLEAREGEDLDRQKLVQAA